jgi:PKD repeat protein
MRKQIKVFLPQMLLTLATLTVYTADSYAQGSYGTVVNDTCFAFNGTQPYTGSCTLCHAASPAPKSQRVDPQWQWWQDQLQNPTPLTNFCPPQTNQAPDGIISAPANNSIVNLGSSVAFTGTGSDPDNNTPLAYAWNFGGAAANSTVQNPSVAFNTAGTFTITFTATDSKGRADPTPATITLTVKDPNANQAPNSTITTPASNANIKVGDSLSFAGSGSDSDNNTPLTYVWNFGGGAADSTLQQ